MNISRDEGEQGARRERGGYVSLELICAGRGAGAVIRDFESLRQFEKLRIGLRGIERRDRESLRAEAGVQALGEQVESELSGVPIFSRDRDFLIVSKRARIVNDGFAHASRLDAGDYAGAQVFSVHESGIIGNRTDERGFRFGDRVRRRKVIPQVTDVAAVHPACVKSVGFAIADLNGGHVGFHVAVFGDQIPTLLEDAASGVAGDAALVDNCDLASIGGTAHPFRVQSDREGGVGEVGDDDALEGLVRTAIFDLGLDGWQPL